MTKTMKTILIATTLMFGGLTATTASAFDMVNGGWHCWFKVSAETCYYPHDGEPYYNFDGTRNVKADDLNESDFAMWGNHGGNIFDPEAWKEFYNPDNWHVDSELSTETEVAMLRPRSEIKYWACMNGATGYTMQNKNSPCKYTPRPVYGRIGSLTTGSGETTIAMMTPEMLKAWDSTLTRSTTYGSIDLDEGYGGAPATEFAFNRRGSTCSSNPYGRRSSYCNESEVEKPLQSEVTASNEFGSCLLDDTPLDIEQLVDCRSDACLGRKFYYGSFGKVGR